MWDSRGGVFLVVMVSRSLWREVVGRGLCGEEDWRDCWLPLEVLARLKRKVSAWLGGESFLVKKHSVENWHRTSLNREQSFETSLRSKFLGFGQKTALVA